MAFFETPFVETEMPKGTGNFEPLPAGWYNANITGAELKNTKDGTGQYISVQYTILGPTHEGRVVFGNLNTKNKNPKAAEIGRQQIGEIMRAAGLPKLDNTDQMLGIQLQIKLAIKTGTEEYPDAKNEIKGFKAMAGAMPKTAGSPPAASTPPWAQKKQGDGIPY